MAEVGLVVGKAGNKRTGTAGTAWPSVRAVIRAAAADALPSSSSGVWLCCGKRPAVCFIE